MSEADDLLRRLADAAHAHHEDTGKGKPDLCVVCLAVADARAYLARPKGPVVTISFCYYRTADGGWSGVEIAEMQLEETVVALRAEMEAQDG